MNTATQNKRIIAAGRLIDGEWIVVTTPDYRHADVDSVVTLTDEQIAAELEDYQEDIADREWFRRGC
jgi:hypothetical protein